MLSVPKNNNVCVVPCSGIYMHPSLTNPIPSAAYLASFPGLPRFVFFCHRFALPIIQGIIVSTNWRAKKRGRPGNHWTKL